MIIVHEHSTPSIATLASFIRNNTPPAIANIFIFILKYNSFA